MSYDLSVFDPLVAPRDRGAFLDWFAEQTTWRHDRDYADPAGATPALRIWYDAIRRDYPAMNGPDATDDHELFDRSGDYNFGSGIIYVAFPWSLAEKIYTTVRHLAVMHQVGFYDVSGDEGDGEIYFPGDALRSPSAGNWRDIARQFARHRNDISPGSEFQ